MCEGCFIRVEGNGLSCSLYEIIAVFHDNIFKKHVDYDAVHSQKPETEDRKLF